jgi:hypothetical protein
MVGRLAFGERKDKGDATFRANSHPPPWNRCPCARTGRPEGAKSLRGKDLRPSGLGPCDQVEPLGRARSTGVR